MFINPLHAIDWYKAEHYRMYPEGTELVYSNFTPRSNKLSNLPKGYRDGIVFFGLQYFIEELLIDTWHDNFFNQPLSRVISAYKRRHKRSLGNDPDTSHIEALHRLGYLPLEIRALPEGTYVPIGVPTLTIKNTHPDFFWLTNYLESVMSAMLWKMCVSATTARYYAQICKSFAEETCENDFHLPFQCHDFSFRGMNGPEDAATSGMGHLTSFSGTDTVLAIDAVEDYYAGPGVELYDDPIGMSVAATEHSVMSMGTMEDEQGTFDRLVSELYPEGIVSIVADTWDFWRVLSEYAPALKEKIEGRSGDMSKVVFRPDSGDPEKIICGDPEISPNGIDWENGEAGNPAYKGALQLLWETFGGTINSKGYKVLNPKVGLIYGDSITPERAKSILSRMKELGFASSNIVFGVGSFTYTYVTRDTYGFAVKATAGRVNGKYRPIYKDPITDDGTKKSLRGFLGVYEAHDGHSSRLIVRDNLEEEPTDDLLETVFKDGLLVNEISFNDIRERVKSTL